MTKILISYKSNYAAGGQGHNLENTLLSEADDDKVIIVSLNYLRLITVKSIKSEELFS